MKKLISLTIVLAIALSLAACGDSRTKLYVYNVGDYIGENVVANFEAAHPDIKVVYTTYDSNEAMYTKLTHTNAKYDVIVPSDYMIERLISEGLLLEINYNNVPNFETYVPDNFKHLSYDPENKYTVPYAYGTVGILYNTTMVDGVPTWEDMWDPKYADSVIMYDSERDSIGATLKMLGYSLNTTDVNELEEAKAKLIAQSGNVAAYLTDPLREKMVAGDCAMALVYSGDASLCIEENPDLAYTVPVVGSNAFYDCLCIPTTSQHKELAEEFINFMLEPESAKDNATMGYSMPHTAVTDDPEYAALAIYPDEEALSHCETFVDLGTEGNDLYADIWSEIKRSVE